MVYSTNQARHLYVANAAKSTVNTKVTESDNVGTISVMTTADKELYFSYKGADTVLRSDLIDPKTIMYAKATKASAIAPKLKGYIVELSDEHGTEIVSGEDYILRINFRQYHSLGEEDTYMKYGVVHGTSGMTANVFYKKMAISLAKNFSREADTLVKFSLVIEDDSSEVVTANTQEASLTGTYKGILIEEMEQPWALGIRGYKELNFDITSATVVKDHEEIVWAEVSQTEDEVLKNGKIIADLEYFCMGERGDQYRMAGWPNYIPTTYLVDPAKDYHVIDIHYAYVGSNESVQKSEKDITIVCDNMATANSIIDLINANAGLNITKLA